MMNFVRFHFSKKGFTIVEVIVIVIVISILAGVSVMGYGQWRRGLAEKVVKSDLKSVANAMKSKRNFSDGYPLLDSGDIFSNQMGYGNAAAIFVSSKEVVLTYINGNTTSFCIEGYSKEYPTIKYKVSQTTSEPVAGTC